MVKPLSTILDDLSDIEIEVLVLRKEWIKIKGSGTEVNGRSYGELG